MDLMTLVKGSAFGLLLVGGGLSVIYAIWLFGGFLSVLLSDRRKAKKWCKEHNCDLRVFEFGPGRFEYFYVGEDRVHGCLWMIPLDYGEPKRCVRDGIAGGVEFYEPTLTDDAEARFLLTWGIVWTVTKVVLAEVAKKAVVKFIEILLERLKEKWGMKSGATEERLEGVAFEEVEDIRGFCEMTEKDRDLAKATIVEIIRYAKERGLRREADFKVSDIANIRLSILAGGTKKAGEEPKIEVRYVSSSSNGYVDPIHREARDGKEVTVATIRVDSPKGDCCKGSKAVAYRGCTEDEWKKGKKEQEAKKAVVLPKDFVDGYEERGW